MQTIEMTATVANNGEVVLRLPSNISPGEHRFVVMIEDQPTVLDAPDLPEFPVISVGAWPEGFSLRREDMYGDDGR